MAYRFFGMTAIALPILVGGGHLWAQDAAGAAGAVPAGTHRPWYELQMMPDPILDQVLLFYLSEARHGMTDIGEVMDTAGRVRADDEYSWTREFAATAARVQKMAEDGEKAGHPLGAGEAWLRASAYYRAALHRHPDPAAPEIRDLAAREVAAYQRAASLLHFPMEIVKIPYENTTLPGYFFRAASARGKAPLLIVHQGRDAWAEDCTYVAQEANARGWHCLLVDGPGMGKTLRLQGLAFRPDWEKVITPVVDFAIKQPGVDAGRMALIGISMGGALAPRAAAYEHRLKLLVANPGVLEWSRVVTGYIEDHIPQAAGMAEKDPATFNGIIAKVVEANPFMRWGMTDTMWKHGCVTPAQLFVEMKKYTNKGFAQMITAKTLVIDGEAEEFGQAKELYDALRCPKDYLMFTARETAQLHVQTGATAVQTQHVFDWLEENL